MEMDNLSVQSTAKKKDKTVEQQHTIRFALELKESNDKYFPEFSFKELLRSASVSIHYFVGFLCLHYTTFSFHRIICKAALTLLSGRGFTDEVKICVELTVYVLKVGEEKEKDLPVDDDGDHEKLQALAKKFEEKYVSSTRFLRF